MDTVKKEKKTKLFLHLKKWSSILCTMSGQINISLVTKFYIIILLNCAVTKEKKKKNETPEGNVKHTIPQQRVHNTVVLLYLTFNTVLYDLIDSRIRRTHF